MIISLIAAMSRHRIIGHDNRLPWHLPIDMQHFKQHTLGKTVIMGYRTFVSMGCQPLRKRRNIILSRETRTLLGAECFNNLDDALASCASEAEVMICGGEKIYRLALPRAHRLYLTLVDADLPGDTHFPAWKQDEWKLIEKSYHAADAENLYACEFVTLERIHSHSSGR